MKRQLSFAAAALFLVTAAFACGDDAVSSPAAGGGEGGPAMSDAGRPQADSGTSDSAARDSAARDSAVSIDAAVLTLTLPWENGAPIDSQYTCTTDNESPGVSWSGAPAETKSFALVMRDTSLAQAENYHWVIFDIPATTTSLPQSLPREAALTSPAGARQTQWSFGADTGYGGPCPPSGTHDYELTLHALDKVLGLTTTDAPTVDAAIKSASIATATIVGKYTKP